MGVLPRPTAMPLSKTPMLRDGLFAAFTGDSGKVLGLLS